MRIYDVLYSMNTGDVTPKARPFDNLLGQALSGGTETKTIDFTPVISVSDAKAGNALDYQFKITAKQTGTPSPDNICPIDGWMGANISRGDSRNLFQTTASSTEMAGVTYTVNADGTVTVSGTASGFSSFNMGEADISNVGAKKITISGIETATNIQWSNIRLYDSNNLVVYETLSSTSPSVTIDLANYPTAVKVITIVKRQNNVATSGVIKPMVEIGDTAHDFEPYETPTVYPVSWQTEAGTVYGVVLDATTGTLTVTHIAEVFDENDDWSYANSRFKCNRVPTSALKTQATSQATTTTYVGTMCNWLKYQNIYGSAYLADNSLVWFATTNNLFIRADGITSLADFETFIAENPLVLIAELAEPITYTITPTEITLTEGANTIWSDTGDSKMTYLAKK